MIVASEAEDAWCPPTFSPSRVVAQVVGVVDHPGGEPQHFLFQLMESGEFVGGDHRRALMECGPISLSHGTRAAIRDRKPAMESADRQCDIAVVGAGPAGLAATIALRAAGWHVVCAGPAPDPARPDRRTTALLGGSVRFLERIELWEALREAAAPLRVLRIIDRTGRLLRAPDIAFDVAEICEEAFGYNIPNAILTAALLKRLGEAHLPTAGVEALEPDAEGVRLRLPGAEALRARLVVGADGRNSLCREAAGIGTRSWTYARPPSPPISATPAPIAAPAPRCIIPPARSPWCRCRATGRALSGWNARPKPPG